MTKKDFLNELVAGLIELPANELRQIKAYYAEMIDDRMEEGMEEEAAVAEIGAPEALAAEILAESGRPAASQEPEKGFGENLLQFSGEIRNLRLNSKYADVVLRPEPLPPGASAQARFFQLRPEEFESSLVEGTLELRQKESARLLDRFHFGKNSRVEIVLAGNEYDALQFRSASGDLRVENLQIGSAELETGAGDAMLSALRVLGDMNARSSAGDIKMERMDVAGHLSVATRAGDAHMEHISAAALRLETQAGDVCAEDVKAGGEIVATSGAGDVHLQQIETPAAITVDTNAGDAKIEGVAAGAVRIATRGGDVAMGNAQIEGLASVESGVGSVRLARLSARWLQIQTNAGDMAAEEVRVGGDVEINTRAGDVELRSVSGEGLQLRAEVGDALLEEGCFTSAKLAATAGDLDLRETEIEGLLAAESTSGDIGLGGVRAGELQLSTGNGDIHGTLRGDGEYRFDAQSRWGDVKAPQGDGPRLVTARTTHGDVRLQVKT